MTKDEALKMALRTLELWDNAGEAPTWYGKQERTDAMKAIRQALDQLPDNTKMIDTGIDRGAWSDVEDATKWVDELRGEDDELPPVKTYCGGKPNYCEPEEQPNSTTDVVEPIGWFTEDHETDKSATTYNAETARRWLEKGWPVTPLYTAPPKREWQGLTDEELYEIVNRKWWDWEDTFDIEGFSRAIEAKLKEKNTHEPRQHQDLCGND